jgi:hypothetical protein
MPKSPVSSGGDQRLETTIGQRSPLVCVASAILARAFGVGEKYIEYARGWGGRACGINLLWEQAPLLHSA